MATEAEKYTKFSDVYNIATFRIRDFTFLKTGNLDVKESALGHFLLAAIADFQNSCEDVDITDYDLDREYPQWNCVLSNEVQQILALGIVYHWLESQVNSTKNFHNLMHGKNYTSYSPANLLGEMSSAKEKLHDEYQGKMYRYSFYHSDIESRKV